MCYIYAHNRERTYIIFIRKGRMYLYMYILVFYIYHKRMSQTYTQFMKFKG